MTSMSTRTKRTICTTSGQGNKVAKLVFIHPLTLSDMSSLSQFGNLEFTNYCIVTKYPI